MRLCERLFSHVWFALHVKPYFLFPDVLKRWSFQKNTRKYYIFFKLSEKMAFPKRAAPAHDLSCIIWKDGIFFRKHDIFPWAESKRRSFSGNTWKYGILEYDLSIIIEKDDISFSRKDDLAP